MKSNVVAAVAGGLVLGAAAFLPLGAQASAEHPAPAVSKSQEQAGVSRDVNSETSASVTIEPSDADQGSQSNVKAADLGSAVTTDPTPTPTPVATPLPTFSSDDEDSNDDGNGFGDDQGEDSESDD